MNRKEIDMAVEWAAKEGWNPGLEDAAAFWAADPTGFLIGLLNGEPVATVSAVKFGNTFGFIGFYIVKPGFRGQGYGIQVWNAAIEYLKNRNIGLDGVVDQQDNYKKSGFTLAYSNIRYEGKTTPANRDLSMITELTINDFNVIHAYDAPFFPALRTAFLKEWISQKNAHVLGIINKNKLTGYGMIRTCRSGFKIGPLFCDTKQLADMIFEALCDSVEPGFPVYLDIPETNPAAIALAEKQDMKEVFKTARMYTKMVPELPIEKLFGVTSFELG